MGLGAKPDIERGLRFENRQPSIFGFGYLSYLERVTQPHDDAAVAAVSRPLVEEVGAGINRGVRRAEVTRVGRVKEFGAELNLMAFQNLRVLEDAEIQVGDAVAANRIAPDVTGALSCGERREEAGATRRANLDEIHAR